jgi:Sodium:alanine symporter family
MKMRRQSVLEIDNLPPKDSLRASLSRVAFSQKTVSEKNWKAGLCILFLYVAMIIYSGFSEKIISHDNQMWAINRHSTLISDCLIGIILVSCLAFLVVGGISRIVKIPKFLIPSWVARIAMIAGILLLPIFYIDLRFEALAKQSATEIEHPQWFLVEKRSNCHYRRRSFRKCDNFHQEGYAFTKTGQRFSIVRYGDRTKYQCVLGQRFANRDGKMWLKIDQITPLEYETNSSGRVTKAGWRQLVMCTRRKAA